MSWLVWDEQKRASNLEKHGLDFVDAVLVLESQYRLDIEVLRSNEVRTQSLAYLFDVLMVLSVVHTVRDTSTRVVSFRPASSDERTAYHEWLENDFHDD
jgi:uncharacterized protein